jgi:hypothetical protein
MNDPHAENHWKDLASILGATPPTEAESPPPSAANLPPIIKPVGQKRPKPAATPPKNADWDSIALNLGIEPPRPVEPQPPVVQPSGPKAIETVPAKQPPYTTVSPETGDESPNFFDEKFDFEEPFDLLESAEGKPASAARAEQVDESEQTVEKSRKRRRRRRPRRRTDNASQQPRSAAAETTPAVAESAESEAPRFQREDEYEESSDHRQSKRRRPRYDKRRRDDRYAEGEPEPARQTADEHELDDDERFHDEFADDEAVADGERSPRAGFRGIPTWDEAVGMLIEKNLAARSKRPADAPRRGGDNRGGQGRPPRHDKRRG